MVFLGGKYHHTCSFAERNICKSLCGFSHDDLVTFATDCIRSVSMHNEYILDGLVRVDIFKNNEGTLVVNELESLEARYFTVNTTELGSSMKFLEDYWERKIYEYIEKI